mmetsp:Transcript_40214/g.68594  ORF Transcript_40214/g.68594 Transcript_40214/m.68594 type:complete len:92 (-) Transcript_40214:1614-1889(-)
MHRNIAHQDPPQVDTAVEWHPEDDLDIADSRVALELQALIPWNYFGRYPSDDFDAGHDLSGQFDCLMYPVAEAAAIVAVDQLLAALEKVTV